jgi:hypothetical protein
LTETTTTILITTMGSSRRKSNTTPHRSSSNNSAQHQHQHRASLSFSSQNNPADNNRGSDAALDKEGGSLSSSLCVDNDDDVFLMTALMSNTSQGGRGAAQAGVNGSGSSSLDPNLMMFMMADADASVLMESPMLITWRGLGMIVAGLLLCAGFSVALGIFAGISISVQYFEATSPQTSASSSAASSLSSSTMLPQYSLNQRTTIWDPSIAYSTSSTSQNSVPLLNRRSADKDGRQSLLLPVVEESAPLGSLPLTSGGSDGLGGSSSSSVDRTASSLNPSSSFQRKPLSSPAASSSLPVENALLLKMDPPRFSYHDMTRVKPRPCPPKHVALKNSKSWFGRSSSSSSSMSHYHSSSNHDPHSHYGQNGTEKPVILGFDKWQDLQAAFQDANAYSAERFMRWNEFFAANEGVFDGKDGTTTTFPSGTHPSLFYEEDIVLRICPGTTVRGRHHQKGSPIFVNAENIILECDDCTFEITGGSHFSFGPNARNVLFRGITFRGAKTTSLLFFHDGAEVSLEDCFFADNFATDKQIGTVADVNSTSVVNFYRCLMENGPNDKPAGLTSLSIRTKDGDIL